MTFKPLFLSAAALALCACGDATKTAPIAPAAQPEMATAAVDTAKLEAILLAQSDKAKARYAARNPMETITFFGLEPGMKIGEALPGGAGWYSKILIPYLGPEGKLVGIDYDFAMWPEFSFATEDFMKTKETWPEDWSAKAREWSPTEGAEVSATTFGREDVAAGSLDAVLFIRAMHNLSRFENEGAYLTKALANTHRMLKAGGMVGVVQHAGPETNEDSWATGSNGYLKRSDVIAAFDAAGFDLVAESDINANPRDVPSNTDGVWRLPPSLSGAEEGSELRAQREAIGESNRMTLKFRKR